MYNPKLIKYFQYDYEMYNQQLLVINGYSQNDENELFENIKCFFLKEVYADNPKEVNKIFTKEQEKYLKEVFRSGITDAGYVFRFAESYSNIICMVVNTHIDNPNFDQHIINRYLIHEIIHCVNRILDYVGVELPRTLNASEDEVHCLTADYMYSRVATVFDKNEFLPKKTTKKT